MKEKQSKRVDLVSIKLVKESSFLYEERKISSPETAAKLFSRFFADLDREKFVVACLNTKNEVNCVEIISIGSLNASIVHPREVYKTAIVSNAASIIVAHNHPSGHIQPSKEDINITKRLKEAGELIGIPLIDHLIIGGENVFSFKESGEL